MTTLFTRAAQAQSAAYAHFNTMVSEEARQVLTLIRERGESYDAEGTIPIWQKMPYGEMSFMTLILMKAQRARGQVAVKRPHAELRDSLMDLIAYALMFLAWLDLIETPGDKDAEGGTK